jgi:hypothetical protein
MCRIFLFLLFIVMNLVGCLIPDSCKQKKIRKDSLAVTYVDDKKNKELFLFPEIEINKRDLYPWELRYIGSNLRITKEFFRCKGSIVNSPIQIHKSEGLVYHFDCCGGFDGHTLLIKDGKEFVYPVLIDLLNYVQEITNKKVIITCGHRCPVHNVYADPSKDAKFSKHLIGAEVDFYVDDFEYNPLAIVDILKRYYNHPFRRSNRFANVLFSSWYNKEIAITLYRSFEGRDLDNCHPYPYISIQVLYDKDYCKGVYFDWQIAYNGYLKN